jgi:putative acetyltransferase
MAASVGLMPARPGTAELVKLYVARHRRGQGLGQALVKWVEHQARTRGDRQIELWSDTRFHAANQLYQRCGFSTTGESRDLHDLSGTTEYAFHKSLSGPPG